MQGGYDNITGLEGIDALARDGTGMTEHINMPRGPAATAPQAIAPRMGAPHPDNRNWRYEYDDLHYKTLKEIRRVMSEWPKLKAEHNANLARPKAIGCAAPACNSIDYLMEGAEIAYNKVCETNTEISKHGKGYLAKKDLDDTLKNVRQVFYCDWRIWRLMEDVVSEMQLHMRTQAATQLSCSGMPS